MKSFKKVAVTILAAVMMLLISTTVFAADSPVKTSFNASLTKKTVTYTGKKQQPKVVVKNEAGKTIKAKYYTVKVKTCKNAGTYKVTIIGKGKYAGYTQTLTYKIKAKTQKVTSTETVMHVFIASTGIFVACMFPIHQFLYLFSTPHGLFSIPLRHTRNLSLPKTSSGKCSNRTGCSLLS